MTILPSVYVLNTTASGALTLSGNAVINIPGLVQVDSSSTSALSASGNAQITAGSIQVVGGVQKTSTVSFKPAAVTHAASVADPRESAKGCGTPPRQSFAFAWNRSDLL